MKKAFFFAAAAAILFGVAVTIREEKKGMKAVKMFLFSTVLFCGTIVFAIAPQFGAFMLLAKVDAALNFQNVILEGVVILPAGIGLAILVGLGQLFLITKFEEACKKKTSA